MKKPVFNSKLLRLLLIIVLVLLAILCISFVAFFFLPNLKIGYHNKQTDYEDRTFHVLVIGRSENDSFLQQVYDGSQRLSSSYHAVVELYVPNSLAEDVSMQSLFDYTSFLNVDGVIAYIDQTDVITNVPVRHDGTTIPLITIGHYSPDIAQVSFIGNNYSELGKKIAEETIASLSQNSTAFIISSSNLNNPNYSTLMNSLLYTLNLSKQTHYRLLDQSGGDTELMMDDSFREESLSVTKEPLLICLSAEDTIRAAQTVTELNKAKKIGIIGFGDNETIEHYLEKGIITELISVDPEKIGETAIRELFEYRNNGYANSYITADVQIRKTPNE